MKFRWGPKAIHQSKRSKSHEATADFDLSFFELTNELFCKEMYRKIPKRSMRKERKSIECNTVFLDLSHHVKKVKNKGCN